jgi:hypothetical protein
MGFLHGRDFDPPDAAKWLWLTPERGTLAVAPRLEQPSVVDRHCRQCLRLPRRCHRGAINYVGEQCFRPDRTFAR